MIFENRVFLSNMLLIGDLVIEDEKTKKIFENRWECQTCICKSNQRQKLISNIFYCGVTCPAHLEPSDVGQITAVTFNIRQG